MSTLTLSAREVHLWRVDLQPSDSTCGQLARLLSTDEQQRADRFCFQRDRQRWVVARAALRQILAKYLALPATELQFEYSGHGKPSLHPKLLCGVNFNLAHSGDLAVVAVTKAPSIGIDLEVIRPLEDRQAIARRYFSLAEQQAFFSLLPEGQSAAFFRCWTRKEAYLKACGQGLSRALDSFDVSLDAPSLGAIELVTEAPARLLRDALDVAAPDHWHLEHLEPLPGYVGACAVAQRSPAFQWHDMPLA